MRAFVAIDLPGVPADPERAAPNEHLTLRFFEELPAASVPGVIDALSAIAREVAPFSLTITGVGAFPSEREPRIVWRGVGEGRAELIELAARLERGFRAIGSPGESRPFVPHLTWFRVRSEKDRERARAVLARTMEPPEIRCSVGAVVLKESTLTDRGAVHRTIASARLGAEVASP